MKRVLSVFLTLLLLFSLTPAVLADGAEASGSCGDDLSYTIAPIGDGSGNYRLTICGSGAMYDYRGFSDDGHSYGNSSYSLAPWYKALRGAVSEVIVEEGVSYLGAYAFQRALYLKSITLPASLTKIGSGCFYDIQIDELTLPAGLTTLDECALNGNIGSLRLAEGNTAFVMTDGVLYSADGMRLVRYPCAAEAASFTVPDTVTEICGAAFYGCSKLSELLLPNTVTTLGMQSFCGCGLSSIELPDGVASLPRECFRGCPLTSFTCPAALTYIGVNAFEGCLLSSIELNEGLKELDRGAFALYDNSALTKISLPASVQTIHGAAFMQSGVETFTVDAENPYFTVKDGLLVSKDGKTLVCVPDQWKLGRLLLPEGVTAIEAYCGYEACGIGEIVFPSTLRCVDEFAFANAMNAEDAGIDLILNNGLERIEANALRGIGRGKLCSVPATVSYIGERALLGYDLCLFGEPPELGYAETGLYEICAPEENRALWNAQEGDWKDCPVKFFTVTLHGDADNDGELEAADAASILRTLVKLEYHDLLWLYRADCDGNGLTASDAAIVLRATVKLY